MLNGPFYILIDIFKVVKEQKEKLNRLIVCNAPGFPTLSLEWQKMENSDMRKQMGMKLDQKGVRIKRIDPTAPEFEVLRPSDIILSFDGVDIANDGTCKF